MYRRFDAETKSLCSCTFQFTVRHTTNRKGSYMINTLCIELPIRKNLKSDCVHDLLKVVGTHWLRIMIEKTIGGDSHAHAYRTASVSSEKIKRSGRDVNKVFFFLHTIRVYSTYAHGEREGGRAEGTLVHHSLHPTQNITQYKWPRHRQRNINNHHRH
uniref:Uncharacterized protein n=1 Tax=Trypanosoma congolense (strain IL3000) TaxID=1068625 RepID=G0UQG7_TRYCI|nr:hypothetical protein TCIL3000_7_4420 [Trypanosoma congolense IL3000]